MNTGLHDTFSEEKIGEIWETIIFVLKKQEKVFTAGEERRLAQTVSQLVFHDKIKQTQISRWILNIDFPDQSPKTYFALVNWGNFLSAIFLNLEKETSWKRN